MIWASQHESLNDYGNDKGADQPEHPCSLIITFIIHFLESIIAPLASTKISMSLVFVAETTCLSLTYSKIPKGRFSHIEEGLDGGSGFHYSLKI